MTQLQRYSIKVDSSAAGVQVGMAADPAGEYVRVDELQFFVTQFFGKQAMDVPAMYPPQSVPAKPATSEPAKINTPAKKPAVGKKAVSEFKSGKFDQNEVDFLANNCGEMTSGELAAALNRPNTAVQTKLWQLSLKAKPSGRSKQGASVASSTPDEAPVAVADSEPAEVFDPSNPFIRQIPESAKPGSGRQVSWS
jgi:hypothetical protein